MEPRPPPPDLLPWARERLNVPASAAQHDLAPLAGDASSRRYFRLRLDDRTAILVHAPPATEKNAAFLEVRERLAAAGVRVPGLLAADLERGFLALEDLGDRVLLPLLDEMTVDDHYARAGDLLLRLAACPLGNGALPAYDETLLREELSRFDQWCLEALLGIHPDRGDRALLARLYDLLVDNALAQPVVLVHRDFHSRNLMLTEGGDMAVIDFQDAVAGPLTYDAVSLLRDCYVRWPAPRVDAWALDYRARLAGAGIPGVPGEQTFLGWFDWMGVQRHLKVLGTFARLSLRDNKPVYLGDLPRVSAYVLEVLGRRAAQSPVAAEFLDWYGRKVAPRLAAPVNAR